MRTSHKSFLVAALFALAIASATANAQTVICVDDDASPGGDGTCWTSPFKYLQDALAAAEASGGTINEIRVAGGIYKPDEDDAHPSGTGDRTTTFQLIDGVSVKGGYAGLADPGDPDQRDLILYETTLSGDLDTNDGTGGDNSENSYHVTTGTGTDATAILDGFTVTGGNADGSWPNSSGGGMLNYEGSPTVSDCAFITNAAKTDGGGMSNALNSHPVLGSCRFMGNSTNIGGGGGVHNNESSPTLINCLFTGNTRVELVPKQAYNDGRSRSGAGRPLGARTVPPAVGDGCVSLGCSFVML